MKRLFAVMVLSVACGIAAMAQKPAVVTSDEPGWQKIGEVTASFKMTTESIVVLGADDFDKIRLKVTDAPINIERVQVHYESGDVEDLEVRDQLQAGGETRAVSLDGSGKDIEKVVFTYQTMPNFQGEKAHVELHGLKRKSANSDSYRDEKRDNDQDSDLENAAEETEADVKEEANEAEAEVREEANQAEAEMREEAGEAEREVKDEKSDAERKMENTRDDLKENVGIVGAEIKDKVYVDKMGPGGQTIYIDKHSKYYYISEQGKKVYVTKAQLKDKPKDDD